jgi:hypothetical protein
MKPTEDEELRMLYQITVNDLAYFKTQQWNVTYYALLVEAAFVGVAQVLGAHILLLERIALGTLSVVAAILALIVIGKLQNSIEVRDSRLEATRRAFTEAFQRAWSAQPKVEGRVSNVFMLRGGVAVTALLTLWLVTCRIGAP